MRLDKFFTSIGKLSRKECSAAVRHGKITVNGEVVKTASVHIDPERDTVIFGGETIRWQKNFYIMLNKPEGYISSTER